MKKLIVFSMIAVKLFAVSSCKEDQEQPQPLNQAPVIVITGNPANLTVELGNPVGLDASGSSDPENKPLTFQWQMVGQPTGSSVAFENAALKTVSVLPTHVGLYRVKLTCSDGEKTSVKEVTITVTAPTVQYPQMISANINQDAVWENINPNPGEADYVVTKSIDVNARLTIKPGVVVEYSADQGMFVSPTGKLVAIGTAENIIVFTGTTRNNVFWKGLTISSPSEENELHFVEINHAGSSFLKGLNNLKASLGIDGANTARLKLMNTVIQNGGGYGIYVENNASLTSARNIKVSNHAGTSIAVPINQIGNLDYLNNFTGNNGYNAVEIIGSEIFHQGETLWPGFQDGTIYYVSGDLLVRSGLKVHSGVNVEFAADKGLHVDGATAYVHADGSATSKITISGKNKVKGFWKGISISSPNANNKLNFVEISFAGSSYLPTLPNKFAGVGLDGDNNTKCSITNTVIRDTKGYGLYSEKSAVLAEFGNNEFRNNTGTAMAISANEVAKLDAGSKFTGGNGFDGVEIMGSTLQLATEVTWNSFNDGSKYFVSGDLEIRSAVKINPGAVFEFNNNTTFIIHRDNNTYLVAKGTAEKKIVFTGRNKTKGYWKGVAIMSNMAQNEFDHVEISFGGSGYLAGLSNRAANLGLDGNNSAKLKMTNSVISNGKGWGMVIEQGSTVNQDITTVNTFNSNDSGAYQIPVQ